MLRSLVGSEMCIRDSGKFDEAKAMYSQTLKCQELALGSDDADTLRTLHDWAGLLKEQGLLDEAKATYERVLHDGAALGRINHWPGQEQSWQRYETVNGLTDLLRRQGKSDEARSLDQWHDALLQEDISYHVRVTFISIHLFAISQYCVFCFVLSKLMRRKI